MFRQVLAIPYFIDSDSGYIFRLELSIPYFMDNNSGYCGSASVSYSVAYC